MPRLPTVFFLLSLMTWTATADALTLTDEERSWLAAHPDLRLGVDASWPPFEFRDPQGRYQGLAADYIALLEQRLGVSLLKRTTRKQSLTEFGGQYYQRCQEVLGLVADSEQLAEQAHSDIPKGTLRITATSEGQKAVIKRAITVRP